MDISKDIRSLSDFKRNTLEIMERMEESGAPMVLTVNGKAKLVVQDAASYQKLLDSLDYDEAVKGIRRGLEDVKADRTQPVRQAFADILKKHGIVQSPPVKYRVKFTASAKRDTSAAYGWLAERTLRAVRWLTRLETAIERLAVLPARCPLAPESEEFSEPIHQFLHGKSPHVYRVLFIVRLDVVYVLHVRHGARRPLEPDEIVFPPETEQS